MLENEKNCQIAARRIFKIRAAREAINHLWGFYRSAVAPPPGSRQLGKRSAMISRDRTPDSRNCDLPKPKQREKLFTRIFATRCVRSELTFRSLRRKRLDGRGKRGERTAGIARYPTAFGSPCVDPQFCVVSGFSAPDSVLTAFRFQ